MSAPTALEILERARTLPWCQRTKLGSYCLGMALDRAAKDLSADCATRDSAYLITRRALGFAPPGRHFLGDGFIDWNDAPGRTEAEVRAVQDRAIELAKEAGRQ